jgi:hypothetical protein
MAAATNAKAGGAAEFRDVLDRALRELDDDERSGPLLRAAGLSLRIELTDLDLVVRVTASSEGDHHLRWGFADEGPPAKLDLAMDSETANAYLQGKESLAVAIARGKVRASGESRVALLYLPVLRLVVEPYRRLVRERYPHMSLT